MIRTVLFLSVFALLGIAQAHEGNACKKDVKKFCKGIKGEDAILKCLKEHKDKLSEKCKQSDHLKD